MFHGAGALASAPLSVFAKEWPVRIDLIDIVKQFGSLRVVNHVNLTIGEGEFFTLLGPSGCGKTTLLRMVAGFNHPDGGDIRFDGMSVLCLPAHGRNTGMVFQNYALFPHMTVFDNVGYGLEARKTPRAEAKTRIMEILEAVQLTELKDRYPRQLSGGQQQRVALARALVIRPSVLLMDEPLSNLDAKLRVTMREEIRRIQKELGITTIYVTHDQEEAMAVSDRIAIFYDGHLQQVDSPKGIYFAPVNRFTAEFMGSCNILELTATGYDAHSGMLAAAVGEDAFVMEAAAAAPGEKVSMMLRPDWFQETSGEDRPLNQFTGIVRDVMFLGTMLVYQVEALGRTLRVDVPALRGQTFKRPGDAITLAFAPSSPVRIAE